LSRFAHLAIVRMFVVGLNQRRELPWYANLFCGRGGGARYFVRGCWEPSRASRRQKLEPTCRVPAICADSQTCNRGNNRSALPRLIAFQSFSENPA
jgi:hypothetical protein